MLLVRLRPVGRGAKVQEEGVSGVSWVVGDKGVVSSWVRRVGDGVGWDMVGWVRVKSLVGGEEKWMMSICVRLGGGAEIFVERGLFALLYVCGAERVCWLKPEHVFWAWA